MPDESSPVELLSPPESHPRPQFRRAHWIDLCGTWDFAYDDDDIGIAQGWFGVAEPFDRKIEIPFPPESALSGIGDTGFHPIVWYRREVTIERKLRGERLRLHFGAVDYRANVWVNGHLVAQHEGGNTPFWAEVGHLTGDKGALIIVVRAQDDPTDLEQPRGKQFWEEDPAFIWLHRTTGIWQPVWLEPLPRITIEELRWTPNLDHLSVEVALRLDRDPPKGSTLRLALIGGEPRRVLVDDSYSIASREIRREVVLARGSDMNPQRRKLLWAPDHPSLIDAIVELVAPDGSVIDRVESYFGLRRAEARDRLFILNGIPTFLRLVLAQNYWPASHLAAPSPDSLRREVELARDLGFNGIRIHQKVEDPRFLYWCDRLGMLVWAEMANAFSFSHRSAARLAREWADVIRRDYNHPSIVAWVPLNESWGVPNLDRSQTQVHFVRSLFHLTKALDPTRPVIANDGWQHAVGDIFGIHDYTQSAQLLGERYSNREAIERTMNEVRPHHHSLLVPGGEIDEQPIVISEFGGLAFSQEGSGEWFAYDEIKEPGDFLDRYDTLVDVLLKSTALAGFCYTQLTDTEQEKNGLLTQDRKPKCDPDAICRINSRPSLAVPSEMLDAFIKEAVEQRRKNRP
jgi:beta-galactosidase/beta-glucuronidase